MASSLLTPTSAAEAVALGSIGHAAADEEWVRLWFSLVGGEVPWRSLALVPAQPGDGAVAAADALARAARPYGLQPIYVLNATTLAPAAVPATVHGLRERTASGARVLIATDSPLAHAASIPIARAADAALLCVALGEAALAAARRVVQVVGPTRFVGAITVHP